MKRFYNFIFYVLIILVHSSCTDIFEPSIEDEELTIIAPADSAGSQTYKVLFWWNPLDNALKYNLQIVSPSFNNIGKLVVDTMVATTKFSYTLDPGTYQWRIRGENGSTRTAYVTRTLTVDTTSLNGQVFTVNSPVDSTYSQSAIMFKWPSIYGATSYTLEIDSFPGNFSNPSEYVLNKSTPYLQYQHTFLNSGIYSWHVKATNSANESTQYSEQRTVIIYKTPPPKITTLKSVVSGSGHLISWSRPAGNNAIKGYKLYIHEVPATPTGTDTSLFTAAVSPNPISVTGTSHSFIGTSGKKYACCIVAIDKALNESPVSYYNVFTK